MVAPPGPSERSSAVRAAPSSAAQRLPCGARGLHGSVPRGGDLQSPRTRGRCLPCPSMPPAPRSRSSAHRWSTWRGLPPRPPRRAGTREPGRTAATTRAGGNRRRRVGVGALAMRRSWRAGAPRCRKGFRRLGAQPRKASCSVLCVFRDRDRDALRRAAARTAKGRPRLPGARTSHPFLRTTAICVTERRAERQPADRPAIRMTDAARVSCRRSRSAHRCRRRLSLRPGPRRTRGSRTRRRAHQVDPARCR
jgi:hypothetical protein